MDQQKYHGRNPVDGTSFFFAIAKKSHTNTDARARRGNKEEKLKGGIKKFKKKKDNGERGVIEKLRNSGTREGDGGSIRWIGLV